MTNVETYTVMDGAVLAADTPPPWSGMSKTDAARRADVLLPGRTARQLAAALAEVGVTVPESSIRRARSAVGTGTPRARGTVQDRELLAAWAAEDDRRAPAAPIAEGETCPECGGPMLWERARTVVHCPACDVVTLPSGVTERAEQRETRGRELAVRRESAPAVDHHAALELAAARERLRDYAARVADELDPAELTGQARDLAAGFVGQLEYLEGMARRATTAAELVSVRDLLGQVMDSLAGQRHIIDAERAQIEAGRVVYVDAEREDQADDWDEWDDDDEDQDQDPEPYQPAPLSLPVLAGNLLMLQQARQRAERARRERNGACEFRHRFGQPPTASHVYGAAPDQADPRADVWQANHYRLERQQSGPFDPAGPVVRCCDKHQAAAEQHVRAQGFENVLYQELT